MGLNGAHVHGKYSIPVASEPDLGVAGPDGECYPVAGGEIAI